MPFHFKKKLNELKTPSTDVLVLTPLQIDVIPSRGGQMGGASRIRQKHVTVGSTQALPDWCAVLGSAPRPSGSGRHDKNSVRLSG